MSRIYSVHVGLDSPEEVREQTKHRAFPVLELGQAQVTFPFEDTAIVDVCDRIVSAALEIRAEALARMVAAA